MIEPMSPVRRMCGGHPSANIAIGMGFGISIGLCLGIAFDAAGKKKDDAD